MAWNVLFDCTALVAETCQGLYALNVKGLHHGVEPQLQCFAGTCSQAQASMRAATIQRLQACTH